MKETKQKLRTEGRTKAAEDKVSLLPSHSTLTVPLTAALIVTLTVTVALIVTLVYLQIKLDFSYMQSGCCF
jgi:hypothetical protein